MPIDPSGVIPIGTLTRHPADWFSPQLYTDGFQLNLPLSPGNINFLAVGLHNNDNAGRVLRVWGVSIESDGGESIAVYRVNGTIGAFDHKCRPARFDQPISTAEIWQENATLPTGSNNPFGFVDQIGLIGTNGFDGNTVLSPFPLWIVPVGFSVVLTNLAGGFKVADFFWFTMSNQ